MWALTYERVGRDIHSAAGPERAKDPSNLREIPVSTTARTNTLDPRAKAIATRSTLPLHLLRNPALEPSSHCRRKSDRQFQPVCTTTPTSGALQIISPSQTTLAKSMMTRTDYSRTRRTKKTFRIMSSPSQLPKPSFPQSRNFLYPTPTKRPFYSSPEMELAPDVTGLGG